MMGVTNEQWRRLYDESQAVNAELLRCLRGAYLCVEPIEDGVFSLRVTAEELRAMRAAIAKAEGRS